MKPVLLVADGDAKLCARCRQFFIPRGYDVVTAADGLDCVRKLRRVRPDVLVLDLGLTWGGGEGVLAWLREDRPAPGIPVVLTAAAGSAHLLSEHATPPIVQGLAKPFLPTALLRRVRFALAQAPRAAGNGSPEPASATRSVA